MGDVVKGKNEKKTKKDERKRYRRGGGQLLVRVSHEAEKNKIDRNFDDFAVNLNVDEIPISSREERRSDMKRKTTTRRRRRKKKGERVGRLEHCFPSINSTMESNEKVFVFGSRYR